MFLAVMSENFPHAKDLPITLEIFLHFVRLLLVH